MSRRPRSRRVVLELTTVTRVHTVRGGGMYALVTGC
jgi:hypothetical protein